MLLFIKTKLWIRLLGFVLIGSGVAFCQETAPVHQSTVLTYAHDFLEILYPEVFNKEHEIALCVTNPGDADWTAVSGVFFSATAKDIFPLAKLISPHPVTTDHVLLSGSIWLAPFEQGRIQELRVYSDVVHQKQLEGLRQLVGSHPNWSDAQVATAVKQAGALFAPSDQDAFVNSMPLGKAERFLGRLRIDGIRFEYPQRDSNGNLQPSNLYWIVEGTGELPDGSHPRYSFTFEPFEGKLIHLSQSLDR